MNQWQSGIVSSWCSNKLNCIYGCFCPACAVATAKTKFDESNWLFNLCCFGLSANQCIARSYIRNGYNIDGNHMSDCFYSYCCIYCSATQLLNEVENRGVMPQNNNASNEITQKYEKILENTPICFDNISSNIDCLCICINVKCETASVYSNFTGYPFWYSYLSNINIWQLNHIIRKKYNIPGDEFHTDIIVPTVYTYTTIETMRTLINRPVTPKTDIEWYNNESLKKSLHEEQDETLQLFNTFEIPT